MSEPDPPGAHPTQPAGPDRRRHRSGAPQLIAPEKARCAVVQPNQA